MSRVDFPSPEGDSTLVLAVGPAETAAWLKGEPANQFAGRPVDLAVRIAALAGDLPADFAGRYGPQRIRRSGTAPAAKKGEARGAEGRADFIHQRGIAWRELNETPIRPNPSSSPTGSELMIEP